MIDGRQIRRTRDAGWSREGPAQGLGHLDVGAAAHGRALADSRSSTLNKVVKALSLAASNSSPAMTERRGDPKTEQAKASQRNRAFETMCTYPQLTYLRW